MMMIQYLQFIMRVGVSTIRAIRIHEHLLDEVTARIRRVQVAAVISVHIVYACAGKQIRN